MFWVQWRLGNLETPLCLGTSQWCSHLKFLRHSGVRNPVHKCYLNIINRLSPFYHISSNILLQRPLWGSLVKLGQSLEPMRRPWYWLAGNRREDRAAHAAPLSCDRPSDTGRLPLGSLCCRPPHFTLFIYPAPALDASKFTTAPLRKSCPELNAGPPGLAGQGKNRVGWLFPENWALYFAWYNFRSC